MSFDEEMRELEDHLAAMEQLVRQLEADQERGPELIEELAELAKAATSSIERAKRAGEMEAAARPSPDAPAA